MQGEREASNRAAVAEERARIARELHDVVAHAVAVMIVQTEAARRLLTRDPVEAAGALRTVSATGAGALDELQHLLKILAARDGEPAELEPAPGLAALDPLLARIRATGTRVDFRQSGERRALPRGLDLTAYRIVQEALTNVLKHGAGAGAEVHLDYRPDHVLIEILDDGQATSVLPGTRGRGLLGMRERVATYGGDLDAGPRPGGGYAVRARLRLGDPG
jgi:signal transduction histidine kinase